MTVATKFKKFFDYLKETGEDPTGNKSVKTFWTTQFDLMEQGFQDGRLHDASLVAYSRLEADLWEEVGG